MAAVQPGAVVNPPDMPAQQRPVPVGPVPSAIDFQPVDGMVDGKPVRLVMVALYTAAGSAFAFFEPDLALTALAKGQQVAAAQRAGLVVPANGVIRPLPGKGTP